ncbi:MAG TPA: alanine--tRNA ligase [Patescibacteria group bacterium]|nr:alanine--tRNA ligase [Patescibacteria group bacterium]
MHTNEIRTTYLEFFKTKNHTIIPSASLVPENDPSVLFNTAGMQPLVPYLLGKPHPMGKRLANTQKCVRTGDIDDVGDDTHLTFFEMLGNWSLGDYFKKDSITWSWEFLTDPKWLHLSPSMLSITVFAGDDNAPRDEESAALWQTLGIPLERIAYLPAEDNWWAVGPTGPCGPDTEIFYWVGQGDPQGNKGTHPDQWMEIWNNVFMQYNRIDANTLEPLPAPCVDTGMGLERTAAILSGMHSVYETDAFTDVLAMIKNLVTEERYNERSARIIADHIRAAVHMIADGVVPNNVDQGYIVRRLIRRAIRELYKMQYEKPALVEIATLFVKKFENVYASVKNNADNIYSEIQKEEVKFQQTLKKGLSEIEKHFVSGGLPLSGIGATDVYTTYGFPLEMTLEIAKEKGIVINEKEIINTFQEEFKKHQDLSRTASAGKFKGGLADHSAKVTALHTTTHLMLAALRKELGSTVHQAGSNITEERTRFDFTYPEKVPRDILDRVEHSVNEAINSHARVTTNVMDKEAAKAAGIEGSFWEKYPDKVTVYQVIAPDGTMYSNELCGGPHVTNTDFIASFGRFKIIKEEASSAGVRRIKAVLV